MDIGQRLKQARLEAGLSQRQLCGDMITRNMLSQIENGAARPSMDTLTFLAGRLGKSVSYFLEEDTVTSPNQPLMERAGALWEQKELEELWRCLSGYQAPDGVFDREYYLLKALAALALAEQTVKEGRVPYGRWLLEEAKLSGAQTPYYTAALEEQRLLLLACLDPEGTVEMASLDQRLLLRARQALKQGNAQLALRQLDACEDTTDPEYLLLRGDVFFAMGDHPQAAQCYRGAEKAFPDRVVRQLEQCYLAMEDYKMAYHYACLGRKE